MEAGAVMQAAADRGGMPSCAGPRQHSDEREAAVVLQAAADGGGTPSCAAPRQHSDAREAAAVLQAAGRVRAQPGASSFPSRSWHLERFPA
jgi:hypothetical protein